MKVAISFPRLTNRATKQTKTCFSTGGPWASLSVLKGLFLASGGDVTLIKTEFEHLIIFIFIIFVLASNTFVNKWTAFIGCGYKNLNKNKLQRDAAEGLKSASSVAGLLV